MKRLPRLPRGVAAGGFAPEVEVSEEGTVPAAGLQSPEVVWAATGAQAGTGGESPEVEVLEEVTDSDAVAAPLNPAEDPAVAGGADARSASGEGFHSVF